jgi:hypothetical protein
MGEMRKLCVMAAIVIAAACLVVGGFALGRQTVKMASKPATLYVKDVGSWNGANVPVRACPSNYGVPSEGASASGPKTLETSIASNVAAQLSFYSDKTRTVEPFLAPNGWQCSVSVGADGGTTVIIYPPHVLQPVAQNGTEETMGVEAQLIPACQSCMAELVCAIFVDAETQRGYPTTFCPSYEPPTESVRFLEGSPTSSYGIASVTDPPGDTGTNALSGADYPAVGALAYGQEGTEGGAASVSCVLPLVYSDLCRAIVNRFVYVEERS